MCNLSLVESGRKAERFLLAEQAHECVQWLKSQGLAVINVEKGSTGARININKSHLCKKFEGIVSAYERTGGRELRYSYVYRFDCEVRWIEGSVQ